MTRVAIVHDWLTGMRGGEIVLEAIAELFLRADLFTLLYIPNRISPEIARLKRHTSWLQRVSFAEKKYRYFLPLMPSMIEKFDLSDFDLIISSSHCVAKGIKKPAGAVHISYVHAPMRYIWTRYDDYFGASRASLSTRIAAKLFRNYLKKWDLQTSTSKRIDAMLANSQFIADQIHSIYGRTAQVIHPFANLKRFTLPRKPGRNYLMVTAFAPYKRVDLAVEAFNQLKLPLLIVGGGQDNERLKKLAGPTVEFLGGLGNSAVSDLYSKCRAFVFPGVEDFGITPVEAMSAGAPVIAFAEGGVTETVTEKTGIFFTAQTVEKLKEAILKMESGQYVFSEQACRTRASHFSKQRFQTQFLDATRKAWRDAGKNPEDLEKSISLPAQD